MLLVRAIVLHELTELAETWEGEFADEDDGNIADAVEDIQVLMGHISKHVLRCEDKLASVSRKSAQSG